MMSKRSRLLIGLAVPVTLLAGTTLAWAASWQIQASPNPSSTENYLNAVTSTSSMNAWAVGTFDNSGGTRRTLIEHFDGANWTRTASPNVGSVDSELNGVRAVASGDVWAVGFWADTGGSDHPLIEHFDGANWTVQTSPHKKGAELLAVGASSSANAWAVGYLESGAGPFAEHWDGANWSIVNPPSIHSGRAMGATTTSTSNAWAVGGYVDSNGNFKTLIEHYDGTGWTRMSSPNQSSTYNVLNAVSANSPSDIWAVGEYQHASDLKLRITILHYDGSSWKVVTHPDKINGDYLGAVKAVSTTDVWGVGAFMDSTGRWKTLIEHFDGVSWTVQSSPNGTGQDNHLTGVASTSSSNRFAVGWDGVLVQSTKTLVLHCVC
jgi:hypothetical protein